MSTPINKNPMDDPFFVEDEIDKLERNDTSDGFEEFIHEIPCEGRQVKAFLEEDLDDWLDSQV